MMWTLIIIGLAFVMWRFMQPQGGEAEAASAAPPPPPPPPPSAPSSEEGGSSSPSSSGEADPFKAPGT